MTTDEATQRLREARSRLWRTLAGDDAKLNNSPDENETIVEYRDMADIIKLNESRAQLRATLSGGCIKQAAAPDMTTETATWMSQKTGRQIVSDVPASAVQQLNKSKAQLKKTLAGAFTKSRARDELVATMQKQNQCPYADNNGGKFNVTQDSPITPSGTPFVGNGYITCRGRNYLELIQEEKYAANAEPTSVPVINTGQNKDEDGNVDDPNDWSPREHQDDYEEEKPEYDAEKEALAILQMHTSADGRIRKHAAKYFLNVNGSGESASDYAVPLARMDNVSQTILYDSEAIDNAFAVAAGRDSGLANYLAMTRLVRLKLREGMELNGAQRDHSIRHMSARYAPIPTPAERDDAILKTMKEANK